MASLAIGISFDQGLDRLLEIVGDLQVAFGALKLRKGSNFQGTDAVISCTEDPKRHELAFQTTSSRGDLTTPDHCRPSARGLSPFSKELHRIFEIFEGNVHLTGDRDVALIWIPNLSNSSSTASSPA
jgi:hypothetical protein